MSGMAGAQLPRPIAAQDDQSDFTLRSYQQEMLEASTMRNVIVAMDTGSGKTHVAIARMRAELERCDASQLVWFLSPTVALTTQQHLAISQHLPHYQSRLLSGMDNVDRWTDQRLWDAVLANIRIVVSTPAVLGDALTHGFVKVQRLALLVLDEAHNCTKKSPMNGIMQNFYLPAQNAGEAVPHILGLSASPVVNARQDNLKTIEGNLDAVVVTPRRHRTDLLQYVHLPELIAEAYPMPFIPPLNSSVPSLQAELRTAVNAYNLDQDPYVISLKEQGDSAALYKVSLNQKTTCKDQLRSLDTRAEELAKQLGHDAAEWYISTCIGRFESGLEQSGTLVMPGIIEKEKMHLASIFRGIKEAGASVTAIREDFTSQKAQVLIDLLTRLYHATFQGIIFVEQRATVAALADLLASHPKTTHDYRLGTFVGTSQSSKRKGSVADLAEPREQQQHLEDFRTGGKNLMIATNVLEEGIDISSCNAVICFDLPKNLVSFVQRRGRARKKSSKYVLMIAENDVKSDPGKWQRLEEQMREAYLDDLRELREAEISEKSDDRVYRTYTVESTNALLTTDNAKAHLYHFCACSTFQSERYVDCRPEITPKKINETASPQFMADVTLPSYIHHSVRHASSSQPFQSERAAIKDAAFEACILLHKARLLNDNLLPLVKQLPTPEETHVDQPSLVQVAQQFNPWTTTTEGTRLQTTAWSSAEATLFDSNNKILSMAISLPHPIPSIDPIELYWNASTEYRIELTGPDHCDCSAAEEEQKRSDTYILLSAVFDARMSGARDFLALFSQSNDHVHNGIASGSQPLMKALQRGLKSSDAGLIHVKGQPGRAYMFQRGSSSGMGSDQEVVVTPFPKRKDFLHPVGNEETMNHAYTSEQVLPATECTIANLPARYALFAAFVPSIMHRVEKAVVAQTLQRTLLSSVGIENLSLVTEAISSAAARESTNYERLEYLGDSILKFCTHLQLMMQHPTWPEAYLTVEKSRITSNNNLAKAALTAGLDRYILTKPFTGHKWRPLYISDVLAAPPGQKREMSSKVIADVVEALIGAAFVDGGLPKALACIKVLLPGEEWADHQTLLDGNVLATTPSTSKSEYQLLEQLVGHHFNHPVLLLEAITHASYVHSNCSSYERLEFLGDAVLDLIVVPKLHSHRRRLKHWGMHRIRQALCNAHFLAFCCMQYCVEQQRFEIVHSGNDESETYRTEETSLPIHIHDFLRLGPQLIPLRRTAVEHFGHLSSLIVEALDRGQVYPWPDLFALAAPKFLSDVVESILGALFVDTGGNLDVCESFLQRLGVFSYMERFLEGNYETAFPKERVGILADKEAVEYETTKHAAENGEEKNLWTCTVSVGGEEVAKVIDCHSKDEAEVRAAHETAGLMEASMSPADRSGWKRKLDVSMDGVEGG